MRIGFPILALIIMIFAIATPIPLVKAQQQRSQEGLSEQKKKKLSSMGPEDLFDMSGDDSRRGTNNNSRRGERNSRPTPTPSSSQRQAPAPAATQPSATPVQQSPEPAPSATVEAAAGITTGAPQSPLSQMDSSDRIDSRWAAPVLVLMALVVSGALYYTLSKLIEKIREGSSG